MSTVKIVSGPCGSGKTYNAINDFLAVSGAGDVLFPARHCFLIVPEQQSVEIEKQLLGRGGINGLISCEIISFNRLVYRILQDANVKTGDPLTPSLSGMLTVKTLNDLGDSLVFFKDITDNPDSVPNLYATLSELHKYEIDGGTLDCAAELIRSTEKSNNLSPQRLRELALILGRFDSLIEKGGFATGAALAARAVSLILSGNSIISGSYIFVDSFTGFTESELSLLRAIAVSCEELRLYLYKENSDSPAFRQANSTFRDVYALLSTIPGCSVENVELSADDHKMTRYSSSESLFYLSRHFCDHIKKSATHPEPGDVSISACRDFYHEIQNLCENIVSLVKSGKYGYDDIAVAVPSVDDSLYLIDAVFRENDIPVFVDARIEMSGHAVIRFADSFLNIISGSGGTESVIALLKTGLFRSVSFTDDDVDRLEALIDKYTCRTLSALEQVVKHNENKALSNNEAVPSHIRLGREMLSLFNSEDGFRKRASAARCVADVIDLIYSFAERTGLDRFGESQRPVTVDDIIFIRVWNVFTDILSECRATLGSVSKRGYKKLVDYTSKLLRAAVQCYKIGFIPYSESHVKVGDFTRSGYVNKKVIFVIGANDGDFPPAPPKSSILKDNERNAIRRSGRSTAFTNEEQIFFTEFKVYSVLCAASEKLYLSYSLVSDDDEPKEPSEVVRRISGLFGGIEVHNYSAADDPVTADEYGGEARISPDLVKDLLNIKDSFRVSATSVEKYVQCPYAYLLSKTLRLGSYEKGFVHTNTIGTFFHALLEHSIRKAVESGSFKDMKSSDISGYVKEASSRFFGDAGNDEISLALKISPHDKVLLERAGSFAESELQNLKNISDSLSAAPSYFETGFGAGGKLPDLVISPVNGSGISAVINGKIDRIDRVTLPDGGTEYLILDYKSGSAASKGDKIESEDENIQLKLYYEAFRQYLERKDARDPGEGGPDGTAALPGAIAYYRYGEDTDNEALHVLNVFTDVNETGLIDLIEASRKSGVRTKQKAIDLRAAAGETVDNVRRKLGDLMEGVFLRPDPSDPERQNGTCKYCEYYNICLSKRRSLNEN